MLTSILLASKFCHFYFQNSPVMSLTPLPPSCLSHHDVPLEYCYSFPTHPCYSSHSAMQSPPWSQMILDRLASSLCLVSSRFVSRQGLRHLFLCLDHSGSCFHFVHYVFSNVTSFLTMALKLVTPCHLFHLLLPLSHTHSHTVSSSLTGELLKAGTSLLLLAAESKLAQCMGLSTHLLAK